MKKQLFRPFAAQKTQRASFLIFFVISILFSLEAMASNGEKNSPPNQKSVQIESFLQKQLDAFYRQNIREKLYLQTDKPYYSAGDTMWFRGFLVDAATLKPLNTSQFIYVELINQKDSVLYRAKIFNEGEGFHNCLAIEPHVPAGNYLLRAYTQWMRNTGEDFLFKKHIPIGNTIDDRIISTVHYNIEDDHSVTASILLTNMYHDPLVQQKLSYAICTDDRIRKNNIRTDDYGRILLRFPPPSRDTSSNRIQLTINDNNLQYETTIFLPAFSNEFDVQFFPESGHLLPLGRQNIAFKAIGSHGLGVDVQGRIVNEQNEEITSFASIHRGMGCFALEPRSGEHYYAEITRENGDFLRIALPPVENSGAALEVVLNDSVIWCRPRISEDLDPSSWQLIVLNRDQIMVRERNVTPDVLKRIPLTQFQPGIARLALVDTLHQKTLCERLVFIPQRNTTQYQFSTDRNDYKKRQWVDAELSVLDPQNLPQTGSFAVSVTDGKIIHQDSTAGNILSDLLLTSDLKGYIEDPGYYFLDNDPMRHFHLDLLMMTQGWTRYSVTDRLQDNYFSVRYPLEWSQSISGNITGLFGRTIKQPVITLMIPEQNHAEIIKLKAQKHFSISGLYFPDSTVLILQATNNKNSKRGITLEIDSASFPDIQTFFPQTHVSRLSSPIPNPYLDVAKQKYYEEGGLRVIDIKPIYVTAQSKEELYQFDNVQATRIMNSQIKEHFKNTPLYQALSFMGLSISTDSKGGKAVSNFNTLYPLAMLNGRRFIPIDDLLYSDVNMYESIGILSPQDAQFAMIPTGILSQVRAGQLQQGKRIGLILLKMKEGTSLENALAPPPLTSRVVISPLGYKKPEAFYQPKYDVPKNLKSDKSDLRTTIYWNPNLRTDDQGKIKFGFYTADRITTYDVTLEGVTDQGKVCRYTTTINRTAEEAP